MSKMIVLILILSFGIGTAQEDLTEKDFPRVGTSGLFKDYNDGLVLPKQESMSGNDYVWDYSNIPNTQELNTILWKPLELATEEQKLDYPEATYFIENKTGSKPTYFFSVNDNVHRLLGFDYNSQSFIYSTPFNYYSYPMQFGKVYSSNFAIASENQDGIYSVVYDGAGTLKLPSGEFKNVSRLKLLTKTVFDDKTDTLYTVEYQFIQKENGIILLRLYEGEASSDPNLLTYNYEYYFKPFITNVNEELSNLTIVYPNPVNNILNVEVPNSLVSGYEIVDMNGKLLKETTHSNRIDVSSLNTGTYILKATLLDNSIVVKKFIKQ